jgi:hypothetical protein
VGKSGDTRDSMLLRVSWVRRAEGGPVELDEVAVLPVWIENNARTRKRKEARNIQPVLIDREVEAITERVAMLESRPEPPERKAKAQVKLERKTLASRLATQQHRRGRILKMLPEGFQVASPALRVREPASSVAVQGPP